MSVDAQLALLEKVNDRNASVQARRNLAFGSVLRSGHFIAASRRLHRLHD